MSSTAAEGMGKSFMVTKPGGAFITFGMELTIRAMVARSPCTHGVILCRIGGTPSMVMASYSSLAPM